MYAWRPNVFYDDVLCEGDSTHNGGKCDICTRPCGFLVPPTYYRLPYLREVNRFPHRAEAVVTIPREVLAAALSATAVLSFV